MFTNNVGYLTSYTETDTLSTVTGRGATTNTSITVGPDLTVQADGGVNYTASRLWLNSHNNYRGAGVHMSGVGSTWFAGTPYTDFDGGYVIARTGTSNDVSSAQYSNALLTVKSSGNVGIGTTNPSYKLDVVGEGKVTGKFRVGGAVMLAEPGTGVLLFGSEGGNQTAIYSASAEAIRINTAGLVGIGTTNPQYKLDVNGIGNFSNGFSNPSSETGYRLKFYDNGGTHNDAGIGLDGSGGGGEIMWFNALGGFYWGLGTGGTKMKLDSSGNLGIGTTSPASRFQSNNASTYNSSTPTGAILASNLAGGNAVIDIGVDATYLGYIQSRNVLNTTPYNLLLNPIGGNIGIGTTNPGGKLEVNTGGTSGWDKLVVTNTTLWGDGSTQYVTIGAGGATGIMMFNPHVVWNSASGTAALRLGRSGGVSSGSWYEVGTGASDSFFIAKDGFYQGPQLYINSAGNVGIGTTSPATKLDVNGVITATGGNSTNWNTAYGWGNHSSAGYVPQARTLTINGTSYDLSANRSWTIATTTPGGSNTQFQYNSSGTLAGASALIYNSTTNRVGINQASPGYDLDVNGQVRVQDKLRIGTGNGVVHMSSSATINASATTVVWAQTVSVGMCAFIEYYILNNNSLTDQRAGTIMVTWNQSGTPTITHTETTTPDIGSTTAVNFTSSLVGSDARINAVNSSANPYTMVMSYKYF
jgi:YD repeat-containing protein